MVRTILSKSQTRLIALACVAEKDLGNIYRRFYDEFRTNDRCPYARQYQAPRLQMLMKLEMSEPIPRPCRIYATNSGWPLNKGKLPNDTNHYCKSDRNPTSLLNRESVSYLKNYCYDFAIVGNCDDVDSCLNAFCHEVGLHEVEDFSSLMSEEELLSVIERWNRCEHI